MLLGSNKTYNKGNNSIWVVKIMADEFGLEMAQKLVIFKEMLL